MSIVAESRKQLSSTVRAGGTIPEPYRLIDLFCGCGGLTWGFLKSHAPLFRAVWANDFNAYAAKTYNFNFGNHCVHGDIVDLLAGGGTLIPQADVVVGGPPCQG